MKAGVTPSTGWGSVKAGSVGTVTALTDANTRCKVDYPEQTGWVGVIAELELAPAGVSSWHDDHI